MRNKQNFSANVAGGWSADFSLWRCLCEMSERLMNRLKLALQSPAAIVVLFALLLVPSLFAQNGLRDIPSTKVEDQFLGFKLPEGARINIFAAEPLLRKPIIFRP